MNGVLERRVTPNTTNRVTCRICFDRVELCLERIDDTPMFVYYRCPECDQWFTIRREDFVRLQESQSERGDDGARV